MGGVRPKETDRGPQKGWLTSWSGRKRPHHRLPGGPHPGVWDNFEAAAF